MAVMRVYGAITNGARLRWRQAEGGKAKLPPSAADLNALLSSGSLSVLIIAVPIRSLRWPSSWCCSAFCLLRWGLVLAPVF